MISINNLIYQARSDNVTVEKQNIQAMISSTPPLFADGEDENTARDKNKKDTKNNINHFNSEDLDYFWNS